MALGSRAFGGRLGHEGEVCMNGIRGFIKKTSETFLALPPWKVTARRQPTMNRVGGTHQTLNLLAL